MIAPGDLAVILGLNLMGAAAPGPDMVLITKTATRSRRHAMATVCGIQTGVLLWCALTVFGAAALLNAFPGALTAVQVVGGVVLMWLGARSIRGGVGPLLPPHPSLATAVLVTLALWLSSFALFTVFARCISTDAVRRKFLRAGPYIDIGAGTFFIGVGAVLFVRGLA